MAAPFRIKRVSARPVSRRGEAAPAGADFRSYLDRLLKMIPAEVVSLYLVGTGLIPADQSTGLLVWALICLVGVVILRAYGTADPENRLPTDWTHVGISIGAFVIWIYSLGGPFEAYKLHIPWLGSLLVLAWTFFMPMVYKGPAE